MRLGRERPRKGGECVDHAASRIASMRLGRERPRKLAVGDLADAGDAALQ